MSAPLKPILKNGRFYNTEQDKPASLLFDTIPSFFHSLFVRKNSIPKNQQQWISYDQVVPSSEIPTITWIGHATFLIQIQGINILTDPILGGASFLYPRRLPPGISLDKLPPIDLVLISHNHHDHMHGDTLIQLKNRFERMQVYVPRGDRPWFDQRGFAQTKEFMWEESTYIINRNTQKIVCTFVPAYHWSQRGFFDKNKSLWGGWMIQTDHMCIYFAGDSAYSRPFFNYIGKLFPYIDVALLPIAHITPRDWMKHTHVEAHEEGQAFLDIGAHHFIPMHWGTFGFGNDHFEVPIDAVQEWWLRNDDTLTQKNLHILKVGQRFIVPSRPIQTDISTVQPAILQKQV
ncbi:MAG: MBL fold metallo-hydrolase [bacterium]|nr:MBL fold metallo-hydrolase [bacterium]